MQLNKKKKIILVVDDDKDLCNLISDIISEEGYSVQKAYDAKTAISKIMRYKIDVLIISLSHVGWFLRFMFKKQGKPVSIDNNL